MQRANSLGKTLMMGKIEGKGRRGWQRMRWLDSITSSMDTNLSKLYWRTEESGRLMYTGSQRVRHDLATEKQQRRSPPPGPLNPQALQSRCRQKMYLYNSVSIHKATTATTASRFQGLACQALSGASSALQHLTRPLPYNL